MTEHKAMTFQTTEPDCDSETVKKIDVEQWLAIRKEEALKIDPSTAEVTWSYKQVLDPYGVYPDLPEEVKQTGRSYFARRPGSKIWVVFDDLPEATHRALWNKHHKKLAFPAGLPLRRKMSEREDRDKFQGEE